MKWGFRWYGAAGDAIPLKHIRQIPGITGVVGTLLNKLPGDVWTNETTILIIIAKRCVTWGNAEFP